MIIQLTNGTCSANNATCLTTTDSVTTMTLQPTTLAYPLRVSHCQAQLCLSSLVAFHFNRQPEPPTSIFTTIN